METFEDIIHELSEIRGKELDFLPEFLEDIIESCDDDLSEIEARYHCKIDAKKEKHHQLQYTHYLTISSVLVEGELYLEIENGINNGTQLVSYSFSESLLPSSRKVDVLKDIVLDSSMYNDPLLLKKARAIFPRYKAILLKLHREQSFDDFVTGGGTNKSDEYYKSEYDKIPKNLFWKKVYQEIDADIRLV